MTRYDLDFSVINATALRLYPGLLHQWFPGGVLHGDEYDALNPLRDDQTRGSFRVNTVTGAWADFATEQRGLTPISLYAAFFNDGDSREAALHLAQQLGVLDDAPADPMIVRLTEQLQRNPKRAVDPSESGWTLIPVDDAAPPPPLPENCPAWTYVTAEGQVLGYVSRIATANGGKRFLPLTYWQNAAGQRVWRHRQFVRPLPVYQRDLLEKFPDWPVLVVEGEKTADAAQQGFEGWVVVTWPQGSSSAAYVDWTVLKGRQVCLLADHDEPGRKAMRIIAEKLAGVAAGLWRIDVEADRPVGWDVADGEWASPAEASAWLDGLPHVELSLTPAGAPPKTPNPRSERLEAALDRGNGKGPVYEAVPEKAVFEPFPVPALQALADWIDTQVGISHPLVTQSITLALASLAMGRRYKSPHGGQGGLSFGLVADSVGELHDYLDVAYRILDAAGLRRLVRMTRFSSDVQLYQSLEKAPAQIYLSADYGAAVALTKKQTSGSTENLLAALTAVSRGKNIQLDRAQVADPKAVMDDNPVLYEPAMTTVALLAFESLTALWRSGEYGRGAVESFSYAFAYAEDQNVQGAPTEDPVPGWLLQKLQAVRGVDPLAEGATHPLSAIFQNSGGLFPFDAIPVASTVSPTTYAALLKPLDDLLKTEMDVRPMILAARRRVGFIATVLAGFGGTAVTDALVSYAVRYELARLEGFQRQKHQAKQDKEQGVYEQVLAVISKHRHRGIRLSCLPAESWGYRRLNEDDRDKLIQKMLDDGVIVKIEPQSTGKAGRQPVAVLVAKAYARQVN